MADTNRRHSLRETREAAVQVLLTVGNIQAPTSGHAPVSATMVNRSDEGLYFETERPLQPGTNIQVKMIPPEAAALGEAYSIHHGRVVWCRRIDALSPRFGIGVRIVDKTVEVRVPNARIH